MSTPAPQRVPKLLLAFNDWQAAGKIDKETGEKLKHLTLSKNPALLDLCDEIGVTGEDQLIQKAVALTADSSSSSSSTRRGRPALNISAVKSANATPEIQEQDEAENQADALLKAKRMRNLKRQSLPDKLPQDVTDRVNQ